jgi:hypothetical protein
MNNIKNNHHTGSSKVLSTCLVSSLTKTRPLISPCVPLPKKRSKKEYKQNSHHSWRISTKNTIEYTRMDDKVGFAVVTNNRTIKKMMRPQSTIYSAGQQALEGTTQTSKPTAISTDSLSTLLPASGNRWTRNSKTRTIRKLVG